MVAHGDVISTNGEVAARCFVNYVFLIISRRIPMAKKGKSMEPLIISSKAKAVLKKNGCNTAGDAFDGLNGWAYWLLDQAAKRAKANGRKTVRSYDFILS